MATETFIPSGRDHLLKSATRWLNYKRQDDDIGKGLWRVHDGLYDLRSFRHPGGSEWIHMTEGQDITEAFEAAHIRFAYTEKILKNYFVKKIETPRNSLTTFEPDGFYRTLRAKAAKVMYSAQVGGPGPGFKTFALQDSLVLLFFLLLAYTCITNSMYWAIICGIVLGMNTSAAHNFFHQADSWRRYYWDLSFLSSRDWRVSHMLSHHLHTNTYNDIEIYGIEPFISFLPTTKNWLQKYLSHGYINLFYLIAFPSEYIKKIVMVSTGEDKLRPENLLPLFEFVALLYGLQMAFGRALVLWLTIHAFSGFWLIFTSLIASHHHPDIYHAGDTPRYVSITIESNNLFRCILNQIGKKLIGDSVNWIQHVM